MKVYVATPAYGGILANSYLSSIISMRHTLMTRGIDCVIDFVTSESLIPRARNLMVEKFMREGSCTHLLFIDADIAFNAELVVSLLQSDKDVACGVYPKKGYDWSKLQQTINPQEPTYQKCLDFNINVTSNSTIENGMVRVLDAATGFMLIKRSVIDRMKDAYKDTLGCVNDVQGYNIDTYVAVFDCMIDPETRRYLSEDFAFCRRWQQLGGEIWVNLAYGLGHEGSFYYTNGLERSFMPNKVLADVKA